MLYEQGGDAACVTVKARPAMVSEPVRDPPELTATVNATEPLPTPLDPDVTVIHDAPLLAVHGHPVCVETATGPPPPPVAPMFWLGGAIE